MDFVRSHALRASVSGSPAISPVVYSRFGPGRGAYSALPRPIRSSQALPTPRSRMIGQRVFAVEARAEAVDLQRLGVHVAALVEEHGGGIARAARPFLAERRVDQRPLFPRPRHPRGTLRSRGRNPPAPPLRALAPTLRERPRRSGPAPDFGLVRRPSQKAPGGVAVRRSSLMKGRGTTFARFISLTYCSSRIA